MKPIITGIIVEYNPFHNGHIHHINEAKRITNCDVLIAVMSPNFVQRGEPAFINKWERTKYALDHGVDIVIELPTYYVLQSADYFAMASVELLKLANIDYLVYGAESLRATKVNFDSEAISKGHSYAFATNSDSPNNILAHAYEKELGDSSIKGIRIQRTNGYHDETITNTISSASAIRKAHLEGTEYSHTSPMDLSGVQTHIFEDYLPYIEYELISKSNDYLETTNIISEGIENLFKKNRNNDLIKDSTNKRYTHSRIKRSLMNIYLNNKKDQEPSLEQFRVLGMTSVGQNHLRSIEKDKYTTQFKNYSNKDQELKASELYALPYSKEYRNQTIESEIKNLIIKK